MKTTGHRLKESIKFHQLRLNAAKAQFDPSLYSFVGEQKQSPEVVDANIYEAERAIARLQTAQGWYNLQVRVEAGGENLTLLEAVKALGGAGRREARWRNASTPRNNPYRYGDAPTRDANTHVAERTISYESALEMATTAARFAAQLRAGIAQGNMAELDVPEGLLRNGDLV